MMEEQTHEDHHKFIQLLIEREEDKKRLRRAIIEKTLTSLIWSLIVFIALAAWKGLTDGK